MAKHRIEISLTDEEEQFEKWMLKDKTYSADTFQETLQRIFYLQLREDMDAYLEESKGEA